MTRTACGCPDFAMGRRRFLATAAATTGALAGAQLFGDAFRQVSYGAALDGNVVVVLSMRGGADGLSMVVPAATADYAVLTQQRPDIVVPSTTLLGHDPRFGLHPAFAPLMPMWNAGSFGAVHSVGLPAPNRSHFDAMVEIEDAAVNDGLRTGWINRTVGLDAAARPENAMQMGSVLLPTSLAGPAPAIGTNDVASLRLASLNTPDANRTTSVRTLWADDTAVAGRSVRDALTTVDQMAGLVADVTRENSTTIQTSLYPKGPLQDVLANTAALVKAKVGARIITVDYGNWDMHVGLGGLGANDWMNTQITHLAGALAAFFQDLGADASRVTVVTLSEFGRRVEQNGSGGVDHGYGNAMLLLGAGVNGGAVRGGWAGLTSLDDGDLGIAQNYQSVLWEVLRSRFPDLSGSRATIFPDLVSPETVGSMR